MTVAVNIPTTPLVVDSMYGGGYRLSGTVDELGSSGQYIVEMYHKANGRRVQRVVSEADGSFVFSWLANIPTRFFIVAFDHGDNPVNAAISDQLTLEPMP